MFLSSHPRLQSIVWMFLWAISFSATMVFVKFIEGVPTITIVFIRFLFSIILILPVFLGQGRSNLKTPLLPYHAMNSVFRIIALLSTYYAYANLPMGLAASVGYTGPMISIVLAMFILREKVGYRKWLAVIVGYVGVLYMLEPDNMAFTMAILVALLANLTSSLAKITTKKITKTDSVAHVMFYGNIISVVLTGAYVISIFETPPQGVWVLLAGVGFAGSLSQLCYIQALKASDVSTVAPFEYLRLLFAIPIGYLVFQETLNHNDIIGCGLIIACSIYLTYREMQKEKPDVT